MNEKSPPRLLIVRPGAEPTHNDEQGGKRWHFLHIDGSKMDPPTFIYEHVSGGFGGECANQCYPDRLFTPPPVPRNGISNRIHNELTDQGFDIIDPPEWWAEAQMVRKVLPEDVALAGPRESTGDGFQVVDAADARKVALAGRTPSDALRNYMKRLTSPHDRQPVTAPLIEAQQIEPAPLGVTVTLPDGTRIEIGHKPAR
tara:strand:- start:714 stop:1313 length:600 start_codon:yes stop_codon:yes gene_type:complete